MAVISFGGVKETVVTRKEFSLEKARKVLKKEVIAVIEKKVRGAIALMLDLPEFQIH
jgi:ketol-acid reductoisomerase